MPGTAKDAPTAPNLEQLPDYHRKMYGTRVPVVQPGRKHKSPISITHLGRQCLQSSQTQFLDRCMMPAHHP